MKFEVQYSNRLAAVRDLKGLYRVHVYHLHVFWRAFFNGVTFLARIFQWRAPFLARCFSCAQFSGARHFRRAVFPARSFQSAARGLCAPHH